MIGYDGIAEVVFRTLTRVLEQHANTASANSDGGVGGGEQPQLVVHQPSMTKTGGDAKKAEEEEKRDINAVDGWDAAANVAQESLNALVAKQTEERRREGEDIAGSSAPVASGQGAEQDSTSTGTAATGKAKEQQDKKKQGLSLPITHSPVYVRIQPCIAPLPWTTTSNSKELVEGENSNKNLHFIVALRDPSHHLQHQTVSQAVPHSWREFGLSYPFVVMMTMADNRSM